MADDSNPYKFGWFDQPYQKSLAKIKRTSKTGLPGDVQHGIPNPTYGDVYSEDTGGMVPNPNIAQPPLAAGNEMMGPPVPVPPDPNEVPGTNPHTGGPVSQLDDWMAHGGSLHTFHQAQVAQGIRPAIDARATPSPTEGMASNTDIRAGWGWEPATQSGSQGSALIAGGGSAGDAARIQANTQAAQAQARRMAEQQARLNASRAAISQSNPNGSVQ